MEPIKSGKLTPGSYLYHLPTKAFFKMLSREATESDEIAVILAGPCCFLKDTNSTVTRVEIDQKYLMTPHMYLVEQTQEAQDFMVKRLECSISKHTSGLEADTRWEMFYEEPYNKIFRTLPDEVKQDATDLIFSEF